MAAGPLLPRAIEDLAALPKGAHERAAAEQIRLRLRQAIEKKPRQAPEEKEFVVTMLSTWGDAREEGRLTQARSALRLVLAARKLQTVFCALQQTVVANADERSSPVTSNRAVAPNPA